MCDFLKPERSFENLEKICRKHLATLYKTIFTKILTFEIYGIKVCKFFRFTKRTISQVCSSFNILQRIIYTLSFT